VAVYTVSAVVFRVRSRLFHFKEGGKRSKNVYFKRLIEISENKTNTVWNIINNVTRKAEKSNHLPHPFKMNSKEVLIVESAEAFNNYF
jgi:hypothetical protein